MEAFVAEQVELDRPQDAREAWLARRAAVSAWQVERGEELETLNAAILGAGAEDAERERRAAEVERLVALLPECPARAVRNLLGTVEGCEWVVAALWELADGVEAGRNDVDVAQVDALCRPPQPGLVRPSRAGALALALVRDDTDALWPAGPPDLGPAPGPDASEAERAGWPHARRDLVLDSRPKWQAELTSILLRRISEVESRLALLRERPDPALQYAALAASFDQSPAGERIRRYNRANVRQRERSLAELAAWRDTQEEREALPVVPVTQDVPAEPAPTDKPTGSAEVRNARGTPASGGMAADWLRFAGRPGCTGATVFGSTPGLSEGLRAGTFGPDCGGVGSL